MSPISYTKLEPLNFSDLDIAFGIEILKFISHLVSNPLLCFYHCASISFLIHLFPLAPSLIRHRLFTFIYAIPRPHFWLVQYFLRQTILPFIAAPTHHTTLLC